jgi:hypothetical protein
LQVEKQFFDIFLNQISEKANVLLTIFVLIRCASSQNAYSPHVVYDDNNKVYAVKMTSSSFLRFIDSTGTFYAKGVTNGKDYIGKGHTAKLVGQGQESKYQTKAEAQALLDYWNLMVAQREAQKKKPSHYSD